MFEYFWDTVETIDKEKTDGFDFFGWQHLLWLAIIFVIIIVCTLAYRRLDDDVRLKARHVFVAVLIAFEIVRYAAVYAIGVPVLHYAPVQLCHICLYLVIIHCLLRECKGKHYIGNFLYLVGIPAGLSALLFPSWASLPAFFNCSSLYSFISHGLFVMYIIAALAAGEIKRDPRTIWISTCGLILMSIGVYIFDIYTERNFMYLVRLSPGSPLAAFQALGDYRIGYLIILAVLVLVLYGIPALIGKLKKERLH